VRISFPAYQVCQAGAVKQPFSYETKARPCRSSRVITPRAAGEQLLRFHSHRTLSSNRDHSHTGSYAGSRFVEGQAQGARHPVHERQQATHVGLAPVQRG